MIQILKPGFYSSIQDLGRFKYQHLGVPVSGVMDRYSAIYANTLLGNDPNCAVLEMTMTGPTLKFRSSTIIAICGADMSPLLNDKEISNNVTIKIQKGDVLSFGRLNEGFRAYLAVKDGFNSPKPLNSRSTYRPVTVFGALMKGMALPISKNIDVVDLPKAKMKFNETILKSTVLPVFKGPEFEKLSGKEQQLLTTTTFNVDRHHNRMAYRVLPPITNTLQPILTSPVLPGTVQLTPSGQLIILMRDAQTTGGYPRILQLSDEAINCLSQKTTANHFRFKLIEI